MNLLLYCRPGFEKECAAEIQSRTAEHGYGGFCRNSEGAGLVDYLAPNESIDVKRRVTYSSLIFARQLIIAAPPLYDLPGTDRATPIVERLLELYDACSEENLYSELWVETLDTNEGKALHKFCKSITTPIVNQLQRSGFKRVFSSKLFPRIHVLVLDYDKARVGISYPGYASDFYMGIPRLKFPKDAPSRSTLKLEEAFLTFLNSEEREELLESGMLAVDLGAAPGGWSYQLINRHLFVSAVDNGPMDRALMASGLLEHVKSDAFTYKPDRPVDWMVCDIVDQPGKVAHLLSKWLRQDYCKRAIVNLKLPMKRRYQETMRCLATIWREGGLQEDLSRLSCKQLFHDREEVTLYVEKSRLNRG